MEITKVDIAELIEDPRNARTHDARNLAAIKASLERFGQVEPLVVRAGTNVVVGGNGRLVAMRSLEWKAVQVTYQDLTDAQAAALALTLNRTAELASWDAGRLAATLEELVDDGETFEGLAGIGFDEAELEKISVRAHERSTPGEAPKVKIVHLETKHLCPECGHEWSALDLDE